MADCVLIEQAWKGFRRLGLFTDIAFKIFEIVFPLKLHIASPYRE